MDQPQGNESAGVMERLLRARLAHDYVTVAGEQLGPDVLTARLQELDAVLEELRMGHPYRAPSANPQIDGLTDKPPAKVLRLLPQIGTPEEIMELLDSVRATIQDDPSDTKALAIVHIRNFYRYDPSPPQGWLRYQREPNLILLLVGMLHRLAGELESVVRIGP